MATRYQIRRDKLRAILKEVEVDAMLITGEKNVSYLTGFSGDSTWLLVMESEEVLLSDFRYGPQLAEECPDVKAYIRSSNMRITEAFSEQVNDHNLNRVGYEGHIVTVELFNVLRKRLPEQDLLPVNGKVEQLRAVKDEYEIEETRKAVRLAEQGIASIEGMITPDATEQHLFYELEHAIRGFGGESVAFHPIIAVGDRAAMCHYRPGTLTISESPILLVDWGAQMHSGYKSDLTRTFLTAPMADSKFETIYKTVLEAQLKAIDAIAPGVPCQEIDSIARDHIREAGFGEYFDHGLGHGIGLDIHEQPRFSQGSEETLEAGMVVTVEPGIYLAGWGGVRIEDDVLVTSDGYEVLSSVPKDWESVTISI